MNSFLDIDPDLNYVQNSLNGSVQNSDYYTLNDFNDSAFSKKFILFNMNIRSFFKNRDDLFSLLNSMNVLPKVIVLNETWLKTEELFMVKFERYNSCHVTRSDRKGGGISVFIDRSIDFVKLSNHCYVNLDIELCVIKFKLYHRNFILISLYRPPSGSIVNFLEILESTLLSISGKDNITCLTGDFNLNILNTLNGDVSKFLSLMHSFHFISMISNPTHFSSSELHPPSLLDHVWIDDLDILSDTTAGIIQVDLTDH